MRTRGNIKSDFRMFLFQMKNIKRVFAVPLIMNLIVLPLLLVASMKKYDDMYYVEEALVLYGQYFIPVLATWWFSFAFIEIVDNPGNELFYVTGRMKNRLVLLWLGLYLVITGIEYLVLGIWINVVLLEFVRVAICSCFYVFLEYAVMFWTGSMTVSFMVSALYWLMTSFGGQIKISWLNCYYNDFMTVEILIERYVWIFVVAIVFYIAGCIGNARKEKYI